MTVIDAASPIPPFEQLRAQLARQIQDHMLAVGTRLPTIRRLAADLGLAVNTVARAYRELEEAGLIETRGRAGSFVSAVGEEGRERARRAAPTTQPCGAILNSFSQWGPLGGVPRDLFALATAGRTDESTFAVDLVVDEDKYVYGFALDSERIIDEWLFHYPHGRRRVLFERNGVESRFGDSLRGPKNIIEEVTRPNSLFLSAAAHHTLAGQANHRERRRRTVELLSDTDNVSRIVDLLKAADLGISDVRAQHGPLNVTNEGSVAIEGEQDLVGSSVFFETEAEWVFVDQWRPARVALMRETPEGPIPLPVGKDRTALGTGSTSSD